jgi:hypothetical protein
MNKNSLIDYTKLIVDKEDQAVKYNDDLHKYWTKEGNQDCISVTTLIHKFATFDEEFWSAYKTLEGLVGETRFKEVKNALLDTKKFNDTYLTFFNIPKDQFDFAKTALLTEWARKRDESCVRGTAIHKARELELLGGQTESFQHLKLGGKFNPDTSNKLKIGEKGIYPEILLSRISEDGKLRLAGQADLVIVDDKDVYILDFKTNKKIETKSYFDRKMKKSSTLMYPLNNIQDCNFWHYTLQLSTYAWMIQKINPEFNIKLLMLIHYDHDDNCETYECEYIKNDVERMLAYYKKQLEHDDFRRSREKIIF